MSYILDALKKADAARERAQGRVPGLMAQPTPVAATEVGTSRLAIVGGLVLLVLLMAGLLAWWLWPTPAVEVARPPVVAQAPVVPVAIPPLASVPPPLPMPPSTPAPPQPKSVDRSAIPVKPASPPPAPRASAVDPNPRYTLQTLPDEIKRELPTLVVGGAMYSEQRSARMVVLNNQVFHEGDQPVPGLLLEEIRLKSAIFLFKGVRYSMAY